MMVLNTNTELGGLDVLGIADTVIAAMLLNYSGKSYKLNSDNTLENQKVIISLVKKIVEDDKH